MITGYKRFSGPTTSDVRSSPSRFAIGILAALAVLGFWIGSLLTGGPNVADAGSDSTVAEEHEADDN